MPNVLAVMPTYLRSGKDLIATKKAVETVTATSQADLLVVDDHSKDLNLVDELEKFCWSVGVEFEYRPSNDGFAKAANLGLRRARRTGRHALTLHADMIFSDNEWLDHLVANEADVVGGLLTYPNGLVQHAGVFFSIINRRFDHIYRLAPKTLAQVKETRTCPVTGAMMLIKHATLEKIGIFDENFRFGYEDIDYCHMVFQAGMKCAYEPMAEAIHHDGWFASSSDNRRSQRMQDGWNYLHEKHRGRDFSEYIPTMIWDEEW